VPDALATIIDHIDKVQKYWVLLSQIEDPLLKQAFSPASHRTFMELAAVGARLAYVQSMRHPAASPPIAALESTPIDAPKNTEPKSSKADLPSKETVAGAVSAVKKMLS
jgi:hypothetical protein